MLFVLCGYIYCFIELIYRGYTHYSMFLLSGFLGVYCINLPDHLYIHKPDYILRVLISTVLCTLGEGITGLIVNVKLGLNVWDYSDLPFTFFWGQCNAFFVLAWALIIGLAGIFFCDGYWYYVCGEREQPYYKIFGKEFLRLPERKANGANGSSALQTANKQ
ncbi:MAG: hypothetical protein ACI4AA_03480 [Lachnospiraceae bacterium]